MKTAGIYLHIPFCTVKCIYCDFYSIETGDNSISRFINSLVKEINEYEIESNDWLFNSMFFGGGTPSLLKAKHIETILEALNKKYDISNIKEITVEVNPGEASLESLKDFRTLGINRISIGVQSLEPNLLKFLNRIHSTDQIFETYNNSRSAGFENINCDLIYSIPGQSWEVWEKNLNAIINLNPNHISAYTLTLEKGTDLYRMVKDKKVTMPQDSQTAEWFLKTNEILNAKDYQCYEISNFAKENFKCEHNLNYWRIHPYLAFGPSAHGFDGNKRWNNIRSLDHYLKQIESGNSPISMVEALTKKDLSNELIGFGLRMDEGINLKNIPNQFLDKFNKNLKKSLKKWDNCIDIKNNRISLSHTGMIYSDAIAVDLML